MKKATTIILTGGGSGGHILPLLSLARALKKASQSCRVVYIGQRGEQLAGHLAAQYRVFDEIYRLPAGKFRRYHGESWLSRLVDLRTLLLNARDFFRVMAGLIYAKRYLKKIKPDLVFSKGGFVAVPVGIAAALAKVPIVTHDSDTVPGLANRIVGRYSKVRTFGLPSSQDQSNNPNFVGIPIDERSKPLDSKQQAAFKRDLGLPSDCLLLLVGGAGLGARDVNDKILAIAPRLLRSFSNLFIIHIAGFMHAQKVSQAYRRIAADQAERVRVLDFTDEFYRYTGAADLIISRAGATTIAELAAQEKAAILIPAAHLTSGHQLKNAAALKRAKAALVVDNDAAPDELLATVSQLLGDRTQRRELAANLAKFAKPDAANQLARILLEAAKTPK